MTTSGFLTFVVALHQVRISDLYVEGFVLLVLFVVDYFHLDGFTEEEEEEDQSRNREENGKRAEKECREERKEQVGNRKSRGNTAAISSTQNILWSSKMEVEDLNIWEKIRRLSSTPACGILDKFINILLFLS